MQNQKTLQQMIKEHEAMMPPEIMNLIKSFDWKKELRMIVNQNQLLLDVAADLEESVYLMILGIVEIGEVFERMMDMHGLPEDKVQKILTEVERQIFSPMHEKLLAITPEPKSENQISTQSDAVSTPSNTIRDEMMKQIEDEPEISTPSKEIKTDSKIKIASIPLSKTTLGAVEPFSLDLDTDSANSVDISEPQTEVPSTKSDIMPEDIIIPEIDMMNAQLNQNTTIKAPETPVTTSTTPPTPPTKGYVVDPYREPIE